MKDDVARARALIAAADNVIVIAHERPDGDAIGSLLALNLSLQQMGKGSVPVLADGLPRSFAFLPGAKQVTRKMPAAADLLVVVDCSDLERTGYEPGAFPRKPDINIDHHPTNTSFAQANLVYPQAASSTQVLYDLAPQLGLPIDLDVATNLLVGLVTDTIGFRTSSVTPAVLRTAADLLEQGAPLAEVYERSLNVRSFVAARYWGRGLSRLQMDGGVLWTSLTLADRRAVGYPGSDDADLVNLMTTIEGAQVVVIFVEQPGGKVKVSWRAREGLDVSRLASQFGGGGHVPAAGATLEGALEEVQARVLAATQALLETIKAGER